MPRRPSEGSLGLLSFGVIVSDAEARAGILGGRDEGMLFDADEIGVRVARG